MDAAIAASEMAASERSGAGFSDADVGGEQSTSDADAGDQQLEPVQEREASADEAMDGGDADSEDSAELVAELLEAADELDTPRRVKGTDGVEVKIPSATKEELDKLLAYVEIKTPSPLSAEVQAQGIKFRADTVAYRAAPENWETVLERPDDFRTLLHEVAAKPEESAGSLDVLHEQVMVNPPMTDPACTVADKLSFRNGQDNDDERDIYQFPGGQTILIDYLLKILECAPGGFFLLTAAAGR